MTVEEAIEKLDFIINNSLIRTEENIGEEAKDKLKPCPFCGNKPEVNGSDNVNGHPYWYVICHKCGCSLYGNEDKQTVVEQWNRRTNNDS